MHLQRIKSCVRCLCMANCLHKLSNLYSPFLTGSLSVLFECFLRHVHTFYGTVVHAFWAYVVVVSVTFCVCLYACVRENEFVCGNVWFCTWTITGFDFTEVMSALALFRVVSYKLLPQSTDAAFQTFLMRSVGVDLSSVWQRLLFPLFLFCT